MPVANPITWHQGRLSRGECRIGARIMELSLDGGAPDMIADILESLVRRKFDAKRRIVSTEVASGQVLRIDPVVGTREALADLGPGLDNVSFVGDRIFVSSIPGEITEILGGGRTRAVIPRGLQ